MKELTLKLDSIDKVKKFVNTVALFEGDFDLTSDRYVVDAKSIMGIFSLDLSSPIKLTVHTDSSFDEIKEKLNDFIV